MKWCWEDWCSWYDRGNTQNSILVVWKVEYIAVCIHLKACIWFEILRYPEELLQMLNFITINLAEIMTCLTCLTWPGTCLAMSSLWSWSLKPLPMTFRRKQIHRRRFTGLSFLVFMDWNAVFMTGRERTAQSPTAAQVLLLLPPSWLDADVSGLTESVGSTFYITKDGLLDLPVILKVQATITTYNCFFTSPMQSMCPCIPVVSTHPTCGWQRKTLPRDSTASAWLRPPALRGCRRWWWLQG